MRSIALSALSAITLSAPAYADCVRIDEQRDNLSPDEQRAALGLMEQALRDAGASIDGDCQVTWELSHARLGSSITATLLGSVAGESFTVSRIEDLPLAYERLAMSVIAGVPVEETATRDTVTAAEADEPARIQSEGLSYVALGGGATLHSSLGPAPGVALGLGYRYELDRWAVDLGGSVLFPTSDESPDRAWHLGGRLLALRFASGDADTSAYGGLGLGLGLGAGGGGLEPAAALGVAFLRTTDIRLFVQGDLILPAYSYEGSPGGYMPATSLSLGFAYKPRPKTTVHLF